MATYASIKYNMALSSSATGAGALTLLATETASSDSTIDFTSGIDSTYDEYVFKFINCHPATTGGVLHFQGNAAGGSGFNETITSTGYYAINREDGTLTQVSYQAGFDQAQGTGYHLLSGDIKNDNDASCNGQLTLYAPSSTTFVKHFIATFEAISNASPPYATNVFTSGYFNTTSSIDEIQFKMSTGDIDSGVIKMYGVS